LILGCDIDFTGVHMKSSANWLGKKEKLTLTAAAVAIFHDLGVISTVDALMTTRTIQGTIAWAGSRALKT